MFSSLWIVYLLDTTQIGHLVVDSAHGELSRAAYHSAGLVPDLERRKSFWTGCRFGLLFVETAALLVARPLVPHLFSPMLLSALIYLVLTGIRYKGQKTGKGLRLVWILAAFAAAFGYLGRRAGVVALTSHM